MITLKRFGSLPNIGTFGQLTIGAHQFFTVEQPWVDNIPYHSCIPEGLYKLVKHESKKYGETYAIVGGTVSHYDHPDYRRFCCLFHTANFSYDVSGCIGLGKLLTYINGKLGVTQSHDSIELFKQYVAEGEKELHIYWAEPETEEYKYD